LQGFRIESVDNFFPVLVLKSFRTMVLTLVVGNVAILEGIGILGAKGNLKMYPYGALPL